MIHYQVTVAVRADLAERFERYMRDKHIPEIMALGCFAHASFEREDDGRFRTRYVAATEGDLERYLVQHTAAFRADFFLHFPEGATATREVWRTLERWKSGSA